MLDMDFNIKIDKHGVRFEVKKINPNNFIIDKVFKKLDKRSKKKDSEKCVNNTSPSDKKEDKSSDYYTIEINV